MLDKKRKRQNDKLQKDILDGVLKESFDADLKKNAINEKSFFLTKSFHGFWLLVSLVLIFLMILWIIPLNYFGPVAKPNKVPSLNELGTYNIEIPQRIDSVNLNDFVVFDNPDIKFVTTKVVTSVCSEVDLNCYADALYFFVRDKIGYVPDPISEYYESPLEVLKSGFADCDGQAILLASLLQSVGIKTKFGFEPNHVFIYAWLRDESLFSGEFDFVWKKFDPTCTSCL